MSRMPGVGSTRGRPLAPGRQICERSQYSRCHRAPLAILRRQIPDRTLQAVDKHERQKVRIRGVSPSRLQHRAQHRRARKARRAHGADRSQPEFWSNQQNAGPARPVEDTEPPPIKRQSTSVNRTRGLGSFPCAPITRRSAPHSRASERMTACIGCPHRTVVSTVTPHSASD